MADVKLVLSDAERSSVLGALSLAVSSAVRLSNRAGAPPSVSEGYRREAEALRALRHKLEGAR